MYCTQCGTKNEDGALSCAKCGEVLLLPEDLARAGAAETIHCTQCGAPNRAGASNCTKCGEALLSPEDLAAFAKARSRVSKKSDKAVPVGPLGNDTVPFLRRDSSDHLRRPGAPRNPRLARSREGQKTRDFGDRSGAVWSRVLVIPWPLRLVCVVACIRF